MAARARQGWNEALHRGRAVAVDLAQVGLADGATARAIEREPRKGIVTGHQNMPEFRLDSGQVGDFIDFLKSL